MSVRIVAHYGTIKAVSVEVKAVYAFVVKVVGVVGRNEAANSWVIVTRLKVVKLQGFGDDANFHRKTVIAFLRRRGKRETRLF